MINKIIHEENPEYMLVAFDKGKTFRHDKYDDYKADIWSFGCSLYHLAKTVPPFNDENLITDDFYNYCLSSINKYNNCGIITII